jgi:hypothetical protein
MFARKKRNNQSELKKISIDVPIKCRCGGKPTKPKAVADCENRWVIRCQVKQCCAYNIGQGIADTIQGWNNLSTHLYR